MKFTDYLFKEVKEIWDNYLTHPFVKEMGEGTLDKDKFKNYLIQDYLYLKEYSKIFCIGIVKAKTMKDMRFFYNSIKGTMDDETAVHIKYLEGFGMSEEEVENCECKLVTSSYTSYMQSLALTGELKEIVATIMPCTWSYSYIGKYLFKTYGENLENNFYKPWIESYASQGYTDFTILWIDYINELCKDLTEEEKEKLKKIFINSSIHEMKFWDMAYENIK
ncbi:thiaminase II [Clostridium gasigenes]|uniref:thiaminase II n=1 Tax=Clostridium gasigenes TaxID=94869 RepID=UPI001C0E7271|nr:thiaminase II [Clostridium gasigenes]MBU3105332.1 thiaminase II [Clostridium gasigenes]